MKNPLNILYIGNTPEYFSQLGQEEKLSMTVVENNLRAVNYLNSNQHPDAIICDYHLTGQNGLFLFDWIRKHPAYNCTPFILLAREFSADIFKQAFTKKVDDFYVASDRLPENFIDRVKFLCGTRKQHSNPVKAEAVAAGYRMPLSKRFFDIAVASSVLLLVSPILLLVILAIRLESKGKVYYIAKELAGKHLIFINSVPCAPVQTTCWQNWLRRKINTIIQLQQQPVRCWIHPAQDAASYLPEIPVHPLCISIHSRYVTTGIIFKKRKLLKQVLHL